MKKECWIHTNAKGQKITETVTYDDKGRVIKKETSIEYPNKDPMKETAKELDALANALDEFSVELRKASDLLKR